MAQRKHPSQRRYPAELRERAVRMVAETRQETGETHGVIPRVADRLGVGVETLRNWVKAAKAGKLHPPGAKTITPEQMELSRVRAENARLRMENEILKKATAYFAKDAL